MTSLSLSLEQRELLGRYRFGLLMLPVCAYFAMGIEGYNAIGAVGIWIHSLNLLPHEAGHFFFHFFGEFMAIAGGSLLQLLLPALIAWSCFRHEQQIGTQLSLLWLGQNFIDVAIYAADAQERTLPLLGGLGPESHDWYNLLSMTGMLEHTSLIAGFLFFMAIPCWALMIAVPKWLW